MITKFTTTIRAINREEDKPLRILSFSVHEGYQAELAKTGNEFVHIPSPEGKAWDQDYRARPKKVIEVDFDAFINMGKVDLALSHTIPQRHALTGICKDLNIPHICLMHCYPNEKWPEITLNQCKSDNEADINVFTTQDALDKWGYNGEENSFVIKHGIDTSLFSKKEGQTSATVLTVSNHFRERGEELGYDRYEKVRALFGQNANDLFVHVGKSPDDWSKPASNPEELAHIYSGNGVFLNTCWRSVLPTSMLEAMSCGMPVVTASNPTIDGIIENGKNGFVTDDPEEMAKCIQEILSNINTRNKMGDEARKTVEDQYGVDKMCSEWNKVFKQALIG